MTPIKHDIGNNDGVKGILILKDGTIKYCWLMKIIVNIISLFPIMYIKKYLVS